MVVVVAKAQQVTTSCTMTAALYSPRITSPTHLWNHPRLPLPSVSLRTTNRENSRRAFSRDFVVLSSSSLSSSSDNRTAVVAPPPKPDPCSAEEVVRSFYEGINDHRLSDVEGIIADSCVYEDLIFPRPFVGRKAILDFFKKFIDIVSADLQFKIDDISNEDSSAVGVTWHLEWKGRPFPFSKGCSFYRLEVINGKRQIVYGRDSVEPAIKPGETALVAIRGLVWLLRSFPQLAERL